MIKIYITIMIVFLISGCSMINNNTSIEKNCSLVPKIGYCKALIPKYFHNQKTHSCEKFYWGGCGGIVPFHNITKCKQLCENNLNKDLLHQLEKSFNNWKKIKINNERNYKYKYSVKYLSWVGFGNKTTIYITKDNNVIKREYTSWNRDINNTVQWIEESSKSLGSHKDGADLQTIEQLYKKCSAILESKNKKDNHIYLTFDKNKIIKQCQFAPKNCVDDCSSGVNISELEFINSFKP
jgi:hypothetical protein